MQALFVLVLACGGKGGAGGSYDVETWNSPLALEFDGAGDASQGETLYFEERWTDTSPYAVGCSSCHHGDVEDTFTVDSDEYNRSGHTVWNAPWREVWKGNEEWSQEESEKLGAYGGQICVKAFLPDGSEMTPEQAAHIEAYMRDLRDVEKPADDIRAEPVDFSFNSWSTQDDFVASVQDEDGTWLYGEALGDVENGEVLTARYCGTCHTRDGEVNPGAIYTESSQDLSTWIARIRRTDVGETDRPNIRMPKLTVDRLSDADLADILAFLTNHYGAEDG